MSRVPIKWIEASDPPDAFPPIDRALDVPDGLLAAGGDLSQDRLLYAYAHGIFPWYDHSQPVLWWSPDPRCVVFPAELHISRRTRRTIRRNNLELSFNESFAEVVGACADERDGQAGTWITPAMIDAYSELHESGWAHSVEIRNDGALVGGLYGLAIGRVFFGESMFSRGFEGSKAALLGLCTLLRHADFALLDCQVASNHLATIGARTLSRRRFASILAEHAVPARPFAGWPAGRFCLDRFAANEGALQ